MSKTIVDVSSMHLIICYALRGCPSIFFKSDPVFAPFLIAISHYCATIFFPLDHQFRILNATNKQNARLEGYSPSLTEHEAVKLQATSLRHTVLLGAFKLQMK